MPTKLFNNNFLLIGLGVVALLGLIFISYHASQTTKQTQIPTHASLQPKTATLPLPVKDKPVTGQIIVKFKPQYTDAQINEHIRQYHASIIKKIEGINQTVIKVPTGQEDIILQQLQSDTYVETTQRDYTTHAFYMPNDPEFSLQYALYNTGQLIQGKTGIARDDIHAETAWDVTRGSGIKVAILDTGVNLNQPDLAGKIVKQSSFVSNTVEDGNGHGTHVAGIITADTNNGIGIAGTCPDCQLIIGKILSDTGDGTTANAIAGITWAADQGAKVINMSLGTTNSQTASLYAQAVTYAMSKGAVVVAAAGNDGTNQLNYPAATTGVISVAGTDNNDQKASWSNYGTWVKIAAPGKNILSTAPTHSFRLEPFGYTPSFPYMYLSGSSMATPYVSGVAALIASTSFGTTPQALSNRLFATADKISGTGTYWVYGRVDAANAVGQAPTTTPIPTSENITPTLYCVGGNGTPPCATIPPLSPSSSPGSTGAIVITGPASGGEKTTPSVSSTPETSISPVSTSSANIGGPLCKKIQISHIFYNLATQLASNSATKIHIKCHSGGDKDNDNPNNGLISKFIALLLKLLELLVEWIIHCTVPPAIGIVPTQSPTTTPVSSTSASPVPSGTTPVPSISL
ncbi:MAG TPA: S8 family peptidase [Candidatus Sulfotelmatobacter sp.]|jgi:thermitase|nr:S8 family peptidase [Candidatus Sulfotelmatobacter sp.]